MFSLATKLSFEIGKPLKIIVKNDLSNFITVFICLYAGGPLYVASREFKRKKIVT